MCRGYVEVSTVQQYIVLVEKNCIGNYVRLMQKNVGSYVYASLLTRQGTAVYPKGQPNTDQSRSKVGAGGGAGPDLQACVTGPNRSLQFT